MLPYTPAQFLRRSMSVTEGQCVYCGGPAEYSGEYDVESGHYSGGYSSDCLRCFGLRQQAWALGHSHMFQYPDGYIAASGAERHAWATSVLMAPAFVAGEHVGWYCPGDHGDGPCGWAPTNAEVADLFAAFEARRVARFGR